MELDLKIGERELKGLLDTGSTQNYIDEEQKLEIKSFPGEQVGFANGGRSTTHRSSLIAFQIVNDDRYYKETFYILERCEPELILGIAFLANQDFALNFRQNYFCVNDRYYPIKGKNSEMESNDKLLSDRNKICVISQSPKASLNNLLGYYKAKNPTLGKISGWKHTVLCENLKPFIQKQYPLPVSKIDETRRELDRLTKLGVIEPSTSNFVPPAFIIFKRNGQARLVIDYRYLNKHTTPMRYPLPTIQNLISQLHGSKVFTTIDLNLGYYQIELEANTKEKTAFILDNRTWQFTRMPFGLSNAPCTFQRAMCSLFGDLNYIKIYLDDLLIHSETEAHHITHLKEVLERIQEKNISVNFEKSKFMTTEVKYLGQKVTPEGVYPDNAKIDTLSEFTPKSKKDIMRAVGLIQWFRPYIKSLSEKLEFMTDQLQKNANLKWTRSETETFSKLISEIKKKTLLTYPDFSKDFNLDADASKTRGGSILRQQNSLIGFYSTKWNQVESRYTIAEKEILIILKSLQHFQNIIFCATVHIYTDSANSLWENPLSSRSQRWKLLFENFKYTLQHKPGKQNVGADFLSRLNAIQCRNTTYEFDVPSIFSEQQKDSSITTMIQKGQAVIKEIENHKLYFDLKNRLIVPLALHNATLKRLHMFLQHPGSSSLYEVIRKYIFIPKLEDRIQIINRKCNVCQKNKIFRSNQGKTSGFPFSRIPFEFVSSDIVGPIKTINFQSPKRKKHFYFISCSDLCTRWTIVKVIWDITADTVVKNFRKNWCNAFGFPQRFLSDRGTQYESEKFQDFCALNGIQHIRTSPYNPRTNGFSERINRSLAEVLRFHRGEELKLLPHLIQRKLNYSYNRSIRSSPFERRFKFSPFDLQQRDISGFIQDTYKREEEEKQQRVVKTNEHRKSLSIDEAKCDLYAKTHASDKCSALWEGPYKLDRTTTDGRAFFWRNEVLVGQNFRNLRFVKRGEDEVGGEVTSEDD